MTHMHIVQPASSRPLTPAIFKASAAFVFALGFLIHVGRMLYGLEDWTRDIFTPPVDIAFGLIIIVPAVSGVLAWRHYSGELAGRIVYGFALLLCLVSVPLHLSTFFTWSTEYLNTFPFWYSAVEVPMFAALAYAMMRLRFG
ncbi:hypothetical protein J1C56_08165 [Aminobacter anthyllidis]|uniref:Uncharacterized protein n=1 Tax=Aminobacter anthyllidis TaxID=1035067 RepID=A0A9X1D3Y1_9HYPH|nr:hypothetical protein [Aminobacter anthyllidis]MBT1155567.1 hypothetical protein [Aminobacter anthyllidis]